MGDLFDGLLYVGIVGSRRRDDTATYTAINDAFLKIYVPDATVIVSGGCPHGGDRFAEIIATALGMAIDRRWSDVPVKKLEGPRIIVHMPDVAAFSHVAPRWRSTRANFERNGLIARDSKTALIASVSPSRTGGTEDTIKKFRRLHRMEPIIV